MWRSNALRSGRCSRFVQSAYERCVIRVLRGWHSHSQWLKGKVQWTLPLVRHGYRSKRTIPRHMKEYQERTGRKLIPGTRKLLDVMNAKSTCCTCTFAVVCQSHPESNRHSSVPQVWTQKALWVVDMIAATTRPWNNSETPSSSKKIHSTER